jgi:conjugative relaxase-like TrwC/TraI family protein
MMLIDFKKMNNLDYHKKQLAYNMTALTAEIQKLFPDELNINVNDPRFKEIVKDLPFNPLMAGGIAKSLGIDDDIVDLKLWEDFCNGYAPADKLPEDSPLHSEVIETPRGPMVRFNKNASPISETGEYVFEKDKKKRLGVEFVFGMAGNVSTVLGRLATEDTTVEKRFKTIMDAVIKDHILPAMLEDALIRTGKDGVELNMVKELLAVSFLHTENRNELPYFHQHMDLLNVALGYDDKLYSLNTEQIVQNKDHYNALFQMKMKPLLEKEFGFVFKPVYLAEDLNNEFLQDHERNICSYDLTDDFVPLNVQEHARARQKEMEDAVKAKGKALSFIELEHARLETREEKTELSPSELKAKWKADYDGLGYSVKHIKKNQNFNQVMPNTYPVQEEQLLNNYQRKVHEQAVRKDQINHDNGGGYILREPVASDQDLISRFLRKHKEVSFTELQFKSHMIKQLIGTCDSLVAEKEAERLFNEHCLHMMDKDKLDYYRDFMKNDMSDPYDRMQKQIRFARNMQFTTKSIRNMEVEISQALESMKPNNHMTFAPQEVNEYILAWESMKTEQFRQKDPEAKPVKMAKGQREAVFNTLTQTGGISNISGRAGAGKSFLVECLKDFYESKGIDMYGTSTSSTATKGLASSTAMKDGNFYNSAKMLQMIRNGKFKLTNKSVLTVDEAGMMDLESLHALVKEVQKAGAKLLLVGESEQLQPVGFGGSFRILNDQFGFTKVSEINRQQDHWQREMVHDFANGKSAMAVKTLYDHGRVAITDTEGERLEMLVKDYMTAQHTEEKTTTVKDAQGKLVKETKKVLVDTPFAQKLIVAATNYDVDKINNRIREELQKQGKLPTDQAKVVCADKIERGFSEGDRVIFTRSSKSMDTDPLNVDNSETGKVIGFKMDKKTNQPIAMQIQMDDGKKVYMDCSGKKKLAIRHGYCSTVHKSQGQTKMSAFYYVSSNLNSLHQAYVACSRHKQNLKMYLSNEMADKMADKLEDKEPTPQMKKVAQWVAKGRGIDLPPEILQSFTETRAFLNNNHDRLDQTGMAKHPVDDFLSLCQSMAQTQYKKSTFDFEILEGKHINTYNEIQQLKKDLAKGIRTPEVMNQVALKSLDELPNHAKTGKLTSLEQLKTLNSIDKAFPEVKKPVVQELIVETFNPTVEVIKPVKPKKKQEFVFTR